MVLGLVAIAPGSAEAHTVSGTESYNICQFIKPPGWSLWYRRALHYGSADVVQCEYYSVPPSEGGSTRCRQYVWNAPGAWWDEYPPQTPFEPKCW